MTILELSPSTPPDWTGAHTGAKHLGVHMRLYSIHLRIDRLSMDHSCVTEILYLDFTCCNHAQSEGIHHRNLLIAIPGGDVLIALVS